MSESLEAVKVEIDHMKKDIDELKVDVKDTKNMLIENISQLTKTQVQQTEILKNQEKQYADMKDDISGLKTHVDSEIGSLRSDFKETTNVHVKWYQTFLSDNIGKLIKILIVLLLLAQGVKFSITEIGKFFGQ